MAIFKSRLKAWIQRRFEPSNTLKLGHKNIFILPNIAGIWVLLCLLILFVLGTNYQNNPILLLCFFLLSFVIYIIHSGFNNLNGLSIKLLPVSNIYVNQELLLRFEIKSANANTSNSASANTRISTKGNINATSRATSNSNTNVSASASAKGNHLNAVIDKKVYRLKRENRNSDIWILALKPEQRGRYTLPLIQLRSEYPFGLIKAWSYFRAERSYLVYPNTIASNWQLEQKEVNDTGDAEVESSSPTLGERNFDGIKPYLPGAPLSNVAWKQVAKQPDSPLLLKSFETPVTVPVSLSFDSVPAQIAETAISQLTSACLELHDDNRPFGLDLSRGSHISSRIDVGSGKEHLKLCLEALATCK